MYVSTCRGQMCEAAAMAELVSIEGQRYLKRNPLGVLGLSFITLGIYFFYWYYQVNDELRRFEHDETISPVRSLMAIIFGWIIIVPPFIAAYNTAKHVQAVEQRLAIQPQIEPALVVVIMLFVSIGNGIYIQEHLNRIWDRASGAACPRFRSTHRFHPPHPAPR
jgi:mannose/fructose/N-acetylgalactosamine-specific phosphotransferase system component IIC